MKKKYIIFYIFLIIILTSIVIIFKSSKKIKENAQLKNEIIETIKKSDSIDLKEVTNFKWDTMYVFTPYSNPRDILKENIDFSGKYSDGMYMIAFIDNNQVSEFIELPNSFIKVDINEPIKVSRDEAKFNIHDKVMIIKTTGLKGEELKLTKRLSVIKCMENQVC